MNATAGETTRVSRLTPPGRAAVAVVGVMGPAAVPLVDAEFRAANGRALDRQVVNRICFGTWADGGEELIVVRRGEDRVEVHCHGGQASVRQVIDSLVRRGAQEVPWIDWLRQTATDQVAADATIALAQARTFKSAAILLDQQRGALSTALATLHELIANRQRRPAIELTSQLLAWSPLGLHLTESWKVALCGRPNVGKSSLLNALVGYERAIVFDQPGTTRDVVTAWTALDGWPVELSDSAGLRDASDALEQAGVGLAARHVREVDLRVLVVDSGAGLTDADRRLLDAIGPELVACNKCDLGDGGLEPMVHEARVVPTSAITGEGLDALTAAITALLVPAAPGAGAAVPFTLAQQTM
ncbi:MAG: GTPase, partial [Pirellulales bacterium]